VYPAQGSNDRDPIEVLDNLSLTLADGLQDNHGLNLAEGGDHTVKDVTQPGEAQDVPVHRQTFASYLLEYHRLHETAMATATTTTATLSPSETGSELITDSPVSDDNDATTTTTTTSTTTSRRGRYMPAFPNPCRPRFGAAQPVPPA
jgi:hypothetical protein